MGTERLIGAQPGHLQAPVRASSAWSRPLRTAADGAELDRWEWRPGDRTDPTAGLHDFLQSHGLAGELAGQRGEVRVALLVGAFGAAVLGGLRPGPASPVPAVPEIVAVAYRTTPQRPAGARAVVGEWTRSWTDSEHAAAVEAVREAIARGEVYQANVVGHRSAGHRAVPGDVAAAVAALPGAVCGAVLAGPGWAVGSGSPERLVRVDGGRITTMPMKGTLAVAPGSREVLLASVKDRAEHVMIVDLERNDLSRVAAVGSVEVERLYDLVEWSGLWQATSTVAATLAPGVTTLDVLRALLPGGSVTGAPKAAACALLAGLEPVGRGPAMGAMGLLWPGGMDLGLTIRTVGVDEDRVHLWAGGGITWSSDPQGEVAEAHAKARPVMAALGCRS